MPSTKLLVLPRSASASGSPISLHDICVLSVLARDLCVPFSSSFFPSPVPCPVSIYCLRYLQSVSLLTSVKVLCDLGLLSPHPSPPDLLAHTRALNVFSLPGLCAVSSAGKQTARSLVRSLLTYHLIKKTFLTIVYKLFYVKYSPVPPYPFCFGAEFSCGSTNMVISRKYLILNFNLFL